MSHPAHLALRACITVLAALVLAGCAQPAAAPETAAPTAAPTAATETAAPTSAPVSEAAAAEGVFESQDGAVRFELPEGWSVDDRSAMGEASQMYDRGPGWLNDVVVVDEDGDRMVWYREHYGNDTVDCREVQTGALEIAIEPFSPELRDRLQQEPAGSGTALILGEVGEASTWDAAAQAGTWSVAMGVVTQLPGAVEGCSDLTDAVWTGTRVAMIDVVADAETATGEPDTTIDFADEQSARAWMASAEADAVIGLLESMRLTDAPLLDTAP